VSAVSSSDLVRAALLSGETPVAPAHPTLVKSLRSSFESGRTRPLPWRIDQILRLRALITNHEAELIEALRADLGKPVREAWLADLLPVRQECDLAVRNVARWARPERVSTPLTLQPGRSYVAREPLGVVLVIAPWNYPVNLLLAPLVGAIAAGNCAVLKPSELSPHTSSLLARLIPEYLDPEAFAVVEGGPEETTRLLGQRFDHIFYTGNGRVARIILHAAAERLTPVTLELGGKSPCIVDSSAQIALTARRIAWGKFLNAGQTCIAPDYVLVPDALEAAFVHELTVAIRSFYGSDPRRSPDYARIVNARHHARLRGLLAGQEIAVGGDHDEAELYFAPTVLRNVSPEAPAMLDEIFGPILPVLRVSGLDEAIAFVRQRPKPLAVYAFTEEVSVEERVVTELSGGGVGINSPVLHFANQNLPFGGVGPSGAGAYHGRASFETFSHRKAVYSRSTWIDPSLIYPPYGARLTRWLRALL